MLVLSCDLQNLTVQQWEIGGAASILNMKKLSLTEVSDLLGLRPILADLSRCFLACPHLATAKNPAVIKFLAGAVPLGRDVHFPQEFLERPPETERAWSSPNHIPTPRKDGKQFQEVKWFAEGHLGIWCPEVGFTTLALGTDPQQLLWESHCQPLSLSFPSQARGRTALV